MVLPEPVLQRKVKVAPPYVASIHGAPHGASARLGEGQERRAKHDARWVGRTRAAVSWLPTEPDDVAAARTVRSSHIAHDVTEGLTHVRKHRTRGAPRHLVVHSDSTSLSSARR